MLYSEAPSRGPTPYPHIYYFTRKRYPFRIFAIEKWYPFHIPCLEICNPFNCSPLVYFYEKRYPFRMESPRMGHYREYPPSPASTVMGFRLNKHSFSCVSFLSCVHSRTKKYKFLETRVLRKRTFSRTLSKGRCFYIMMDKRQTKVKVLMS